jgi:hypothetical protein
VHVVTVPRVRDQRPDVLWLRMCEVLGIDPAWAPLDSTRTNRSLGVAETQVIRKLNARMDRATRRESSYDELIRQMLAEDQLVHRAASPPVRLPLAHFDWAEERTERWIEWIEGSGVHVVGDLEDLRPVRPAEGEAWHNPDKVKRRQQLNAAIDALAAMTREAASRPDPDRQLAHRVRTQASRLRSR